MVLNNHNNLNLNSNNKTKCKQQQQQTKFKQPEHPQHLNQIQQQQSKFLKHNFLSFNSFVSNLQPLTSYLFVTTLYDKKKYCIQLNKSLSQITYQFIFLRHIFFQPKKNNSNLIISINCVCTNVKPSRTYIQLKTSTP